MNEQSCQQGVQRKVQGAGITLGTIENREQSEDDGYGEERIANTQSGIVASQHLIDGIEAFEFAGEPKKHCQNGKQHENSSRH